MSRWRAWLLWPGWLLLVTAFLWTAARRVPPGTTMGRPPAPHPGFPAPDFRLRTLDGQVVQLSQLRGRVVIINFWASWCPPCRAEMPALQRVYEAYHDQGLELLAVNLTPQDRLPDIEAFVHKHGLTFPILLDEEGAVAQQYRVHAVPTTYFVDREGVIRDVVFGGPMAEALLRTRVEALLEARP